MENKISSIESKASICGSKDPHIHNHRRATDAIQGIDSYMRKD